MRVRLLCFAAVRDLVGFDERSIDLPADVSSVASLRNWLEREIPELRGRLGSVRFARNEAFAADHDLLAEGDDVALIPPVAGG
jgi:molybdopterin converting factor subunit 1